MRPSKRQPDELRTIRITRGYTRHAEGSVLIECGDTKVICTVSIEDKVPPFLQGKGRGWLTAEYGMLPRATNTRSGREAARGKQSGRTQEIQRLIGRALRAVVDLEKMGERTLQIDCDVIQADGGTRTASITGAYVAVHDAISHMLEKKLVAASPLLDSVAAVSVGLRGLPVSTWITRRIRRAYRHECGDDQSGGLIEVQGAAEPFSRAEMDAISISQGIRRDRSPDIGIEDINPAQV
jgi:ribonuclease PH